MDIRPRGLPHLPRPGAQSEVADMTMYTMTPGTIIILGETSDLRSIYDVEVLSAAIGDLSGYGSTLLTNNRNHNTSTLWTDTESEVIVKEIEKCFEQAFGYNSMEIAQLKQNLEIIMYGKEIFTTQNTLTDEITSLCDVINHGINALKKCQIPGPYKLFIPFNNRKESRARSNRKHYEPSDIRTVQREKKFRDPYSQKRNTRL